METRDQMHPQVPHSLLVDADANCCLRPELGLFSGTPTQPQSMAAGPKGSEGQMVAILFI